ncbi:hypothetical protein VTK73DRAFT_7900 [Phialemonium thermophilum]|uniref:Uncharacterized protein n=1 Tax=Phialemonium thermophilum TaxID=223376 RepID=A0ABR3WBY5_9PEZI
MASVGVLCGNEGPSKAALHKVRTSPCGAQNWCRGRWPTRVGRRPWGEDLLCWRALTREGGLGLGKEGLAGRKGCHSSFTKARASKIRRRIRPADPALASRC